MSCIHGDANWCGQCSGPWPYGGRRGLSLVPPPVEPGRYGPVTVLYDSDFGGFLGYEFESGLYSSLSTLPPALRGYITGETEIELECVNGHSRRAHGYFDGRGRQCCRVCDREKTARHKEKGRVLTTARHEPQAREEER